MGYTHYWDTNSSIHQINRKEYAKAIKEIEKALKVYTSDTAKVLDIVVPIENKSDNFGIFINGIGKDGHETFYLPKNIEDFTGAGGHLGGTDFCKTNHKPYDIIVTAILARMAEVKGFSVSSDGSIEDWQQGIKLAKKLFKTPIKQIYKMLN